MVAGNQGHLQNAGDEERHQAERPRRGHMDKVELLLLTVADDVKHRRHVHVQPAEIRQVERRDSGETLYPVISISLAAVSLAAGDYLQWQLLRPAILIEAPEDARNPVHLLERIGEQGDPRPRPLRGRHIRQHLRTQVSEKVPLAAMIIGCEGMREQ